MNIEKMTLGISAINQNTVNMFIYVAGSENYFNLEQCIILKAVGASLWRDIKKNFKDFTMLEIADFIIDSAEEWKEKNGGK